MTVKCANECKPAGNSISDFNKHISGIFFTNPGYSRKSLSFCFCSDGGVFSGPWPRSTYPFPCYAKTPADLFQRVAAVLQSEPEPEHFSPCLKVIEHLIELFPQDLACRCFFGAREVLVLEEISGWLSSSSPIGVSRDTGSCAILWISSTLSEAISISAAISSAAGSLPRRCTAASRRVSAC